MRSEKEGMVLFIQPAMPTHGLHAGGGQYVTRRCETQVNRRCSSQPCTKRRAAVTMEERGGKKGSSSNDKSKARSGGNEQKNKGFFGRLKESILRPIVTVPGGGTGGDLLDCVFCKGSGFRDCDACKGTGEDALGTCFMCDGKSHLKCAVCNGVGKVDRIRRGGTDDRNEYTVKKRK